MNHNRYSLDHLHSAPLHGIIASAAAALLSASSLARLAPPEIGALTAFEGDEMIGLAVDDQQRPNIVAGGGNYLVVWEEERTVLNGFVFSNSPLLGNQLDVYAMRLDANGNPLDPQPIVVCNLGRNQTKPRAAWNGSQWLVVFQSEQPDWYFNKNILAVRISALGQVLDPDPIVIFQQTGNWGGTTPSAASDGVNFLVMWETVIENPNPTDVVAAKRVSPSGVILDPSLVVIATAGLHPVAAFDGTKYMIAWRYYLGTVQFRRFNTDLTPIDPALRPLISARQGPEIACNGDQFMIAADDAFRIANDGTILDPTGLDVFPGGQYAETMPSVAWTGAHWAFTYASIDPVANHNARMVRITTAGQVLDPTPIAVSARGDEQEWSVVVAGDGSGAAQVTYVSRDLYVARATDVMSSKVTSGGTVLPRSEISVGLPRQSRVEFASGAPGQHLAVCQSESGGLTRLLAQRLNLDGTAIDPEPIVLAEGDETFTAAPQVAFNGSVYLVIWDDGAGNVVGKRLSTDGTVLDQGPILIANARTSGAVAAAGDIFVVGIFEYVALHEPLQYPEFVRVRGSDGMVLDPDSRMLAGGFATSMSAASVGDRTILVWAQWGSHDSNTAYAQGTLLDANGPVSDLMRISTEVGELPAVAGSADRALVVFCDDVNRPALDLECRIVLADGTMPWPESIVCDAPSEQSFPTVAWDGANFLAAWTDFRTNQNVDQLRGDIWAARIDSTGLVLDPGGFQLTSGVLPEDLAGIASSNGLSVVAFSMLHGVDSPEVQRLLFRTVGGDGGSPTLAITGNCPGTVNVAVDNATPGGNVAIIYANGQGSVRIPNGNPCAGTVLGLNASSQLFRTLRADANGDVSVNLSVPANACGKYVQALDAATCGTTNVEQL